jgi:hypothetical protein
MLATRRYERVVHGALAPAAIWEQHLQGRRRGEELHRGRAPKAQGLKLASVPLCVDAREELESRRSRGDDASPEHVGVALQRYRSFFRLCPALTPLPLQGITGLAAAGSSCSLRDGLVGGGPLRVRLRGRGRRLGPIVLPEVLG